MKRRHRFLRVGLLTACTPWWLGAALAQTAAQSPAAVPVQAAPSAGEQARPAASTAEPVRFPIPGFEVKGDNPLSAAETTLALAPFLRAEATLEVLQQATAALETALRNKGYGLHRVALPPQALGEGVTLEVVRFTIGRVSIEGLKALDEANIRASMPELKEGESPNFRTLAVQTAIANDNQGKQVQVTLSESDVPDRIDAVVKVQETKPWALAVALSNAGSSATGRDRLTVAGSHHNLFNRDHQFTGAYTTAPSRASDVQQIGLSYQVPFYALGGTLGASYTHSDVVGDFGAFNSRGAGRTWGVNYTHHLPPEGGYRAFLGLSLEDKVFNAAEVAGLTVGQRKRSRPIALSYSARRESDASYWSYRNELAFNTGGGSGNSASAYASENQPGSNRIDSNRWRALRGSGQYTASLEQGWFWGLRGQWQWSPDALISGEQFGVGGASTVRGMGERVLSSDSGGLLSLEITSAPLAPGLRLSGFVDAAWLSNRRPNGSNRLASDRVASAGFGLRYALPKVQLQLGWARVMSGSTLSPAFNSEAPKSGDHKLHLNLSGRF
jgi:hemolysin activation/secretion protein